MSKQILIADNSLEDALILEASLRKKGVANPIQKLRDGAMTIAYLEGTGPFSDRARYPLPSILFLDLMVGGKKSQEVLEWLQRRDAENKPRVIISAQSGGLAELQQCRQLGAHAFLLKDAMDEQIKKLLFQFPDEWEFGDPARG